MRRLLSQFVPTVRKEKLIELAGLFILLPAQPPESEILGYQTSKSICTLWERRAPVPTEMLSD